MHLLKVHVAEKFQLQSFISIKYEGSSGPYSFEFTDVIMWFYIHWVFAHLKSGFADIYNCNSFCSLIMSSNM